MINNFAAFILSHGRPSEVFTYETLLKCGYTGKIFIVIDNEDKKADQYYRKYGDAVLMFNKQLYADKTDQGDNLNDLRTTTHARNAIFDFAESYGYKYFIQLDDDYTAFRYRFVNDKYTTKGQVKDLDLLFDNLINYFKTTNIISIALAQGGDFIGGEGCHLLANYNNGSRKCMNSFICSTERRFKFVSRLNEDVNTYLSLGAVGNLFLTVPFVGIEQKQTQCTKGGMTETYKDNGTYQKSFFTSMYCPSFSKVALMGFKTHRMHHSIDWNAAVPVIIDEKYKKL